jgi:hypothetical protein
MYFEKSKNFLRGLQDIIFCFNAKNLKKKKSKKHSLMKALVNLIEQLYKIVV